MAKIFIFSLKFLFDLKRIKIAIPLPVSNPDITDDKLIAPFKYSSVNMILEPQLGIKPIKLVINGPNGESLRKILLK